MAIGNYYPVDLAISDNDLFLGTNSNRNNTVNYTAQAVVDYLNTNAMSHDEIITALKVELKEKGMTGKTHYQQGLYRWIEDKTFELYRGRTIEPAVPGYGQSMF